MRQIVLYSLLYICTVCYAQSENGSVLESGMRNDQAVTPVTTIGTVEEMGVDSLVAAPVSADSTAVSLLSVPYPLWQRSTLFSAWSPWRPFGGGSFWNIHKGLNAQVDAGVMVGFGKNNPFHGTSFFTNLSLLYAQPVSERWTVAVGGEVSKFRMWNDDILTARVDAMANYKINERLDAAVFVSHQFDPFSSSYIRPWSPFLDRCTEVGASLTWKCSDWGTIGVSFVQTIIDANSSFYGNPAHFHNPVQPNHNPHDKR